MNNFVVLVNNDDRFPFRLKNISSLSGVGQSRSMEHGNQVRDQKCQHLSLKTRKWTQSLNLQNRSFNKQSFQMDKQKVIVGTRAVEFLPSEDSKKIAIWQIESGKQQSFGPALDISCMKYLDNNLVCAVASGADTCFQLWDLQVIFVVGLLEIDSFKADKMVSEIFKLTLNVAFISTLPVISMQIDQNKLIFGTGAYGEIWDLQSNTRISKLEFE